MLLGVPQQATRKRRMPPIMGRAGEMQASWPPKVVIIGTIPLKTVNLAILSARAGSDTFDLFQQFGVFLDLAVR